ncbi:hypothetical protein EV586_11434 [Tumebacillus sp. BK434]|uniref:hypothetical protein n=1 Tax=Tumebacillus sp. BK434 TaxID=2512169 RepID=UPI00105399D9|nr:hypothetical protein [Tumebacillus sp. BK434]TCP52183.1 hypothetical protein EV586_11434 [Tumebacillus sp. BK434]
MNKKKLANWIIRLSSVAAVTALAGYLGEHSTANSAVTTTSQVEANTDTVSEWDWNWELPFFGDETEDDTTDPSDGQGLPSQQTPPGTGGRGHHGHGESNSEYRQSPGAQYPAEDGSSNGSFSWLPSTPDTKTHGS